MRNVHQHLLEYTFRHILVQTTLAVKLTISICLYLLPSFPTVSNTCDNCCSLLVSKLLPANQATNQAVSYWQPGRHLNYTARHDPYTSIM